MLDNDHRFHVAIMATEDRGRTLRSRQPISSQGPKRVFRLGSLRESLRQAWVR